MRIDSRSIKTNERVGVALVPAGIGGALLYAGLSGLGLGSGLAIGISIAGAVIGAFWLSRRLPSDLDGVLRRHTLRAVLWALLGVVAVGATARLATFMVDETKVENSMFPFDEFFVHHSCLSAHYQAAHLHRDGVANIYERTHYEGPKGEPKFLGGFVVDVFLYPPPFLLLARLGLALSENFAAWRAVWFAVEGALVAGAVLALGLWIGGPVGRRAVWLSPLVWLSLPTLITLQFGNFQLVAIAGAILAMLAFERDRHALGGAILAALVLSKIFPGVLVLLLLFQRRWRSAAWTAGFGLFFLAVTYALIGEGPFQALVSYHLPRLSSGAAFESLFAYPDTIAANHAVYGLVQKLSLLGLPGASETTAIAVSWIYTAVLIGLVALAARPAAGAPAPDGRLRRAVLWLALLQLASLRSPFTPDTYAQFALVWIVVLLLADTERRGRRPIALGALLLLANFMVPTVPVMPLPALLGFTLALQLVFIGLCLWIVAGQRRWGAANALE